MPDWKSRSDDDLASAYKATGSQEAWAEIYDRHYDRLVRLAKTYVGQLQAAQDIASEVIDSLPEKIRKWSPKGFNAWLGRIAINKAHDWLRKQERHKEVLRKLVTDSGPFELTFESEMEIYGNSDTGDVKLLMWLVARLPNAQKQYIEFRYIQHRGRLSHTEVAEILGIDARAARKRECMAKKLLKKRLHGLIEGAIDESAALLDMESAELKVLLKERPVYVKARLEACLGYHPHEIDTASEEDRKMKLFRWYFKVAAQGVPEAQFVVAAAYAQGEGVAQDHAEAIKWYLKAAAQGDADAMFNIGYAHSRGEGVAQDHAEAIKWYLKAAAQGDSDAMFNIGCSYDRGEGVAQDHAEAIKWYLKAAAQGDSDAMFKIGCSYDRDKDIAQDHAEAVKWYHKAAVKGHPGAQYCLGLIHSEGNGVPKDYAEAVKWYHKAAVKGHPGAQYRLGLMHSEGNGVPKDYAEAVKWYHKAAVRGHPGAQYRLGLMHSEGNGVPKEYAEAIKWYRKAAVQGHPGAQYRLGLMWDQGKGVAEDCVKAVRWYLKAAVQGHPGAQYRLGLMCAEAWGVPQDRIQAHKWFNLAAAQGEEEAQRDRDRVARKMTSEQIAEAQALARKFVPRIP